MNNRRKWLQAIRVHSVDSFQGSESDIVLLSFVRSNPIHRVGFLKDFQRLNVALTRAKYLLICVGDVSTIGAHTSKGDVLSSFVQHVKANGMRHFYARF